MVVFFFILGLVVIGLAVYVYFLYTRQQLPLEEQPFHLNLANAREGGAFGREIKVSEGINGRKVVTIMPRDFPAHYYRKNKDMIAPKTFVVDRGKHVTFPKGVWSKTDTISLSLPATAEELSEQMKDTMLGKVLALYIEMQNVSNIEIEAMREGINRQNKHIHEMGYGEVSIENLKRVNALYDDMLRTIRDARKDKSTSSFSPPNTNFGDN